MERDPILTLLGLGVVLVFAVGAVVLLLRVSGRAITQRGGFVQGYPPSQYPAQALTRAGPLAALVATQARLLSLYEHVPPHSELAIWLRPFLVELRDHGHGLPRDGDHADLRAARAARPAGGHGD